MKQTELVNGKKKVEKELTFWKMWNNDLPGSFPKMKFTGDLMERWGLAYSNVIARLKKEEFVSLKIDLRFMFESYGIGFDVQGSGFFLDKRQFDSIMESEENEMAKQFGLSKTAA